MCKNLLQLCAPKNTFTEERLHQSEGKLSGAHNMLKLGTDH